MTEIRDIKRLELEVVRYRAVPPMLPLEPIRKRRRRDACGADSLPSSESSGPSSSYYPSLPLSLSSSGGSQSQPVDDAVDVAAVARPLMNIQFQ